MLQPDVKQFADNLVEEIKYSDTPFVLGIDGGYGTGKTYFSTRFTKYLKEKDINAIYCSVWENDYLENPFIAISKEIIKNINAASKINKTKDILDKLNKSIVNVFSCLKFSASIGMPSINRNSLEAKKSSSMIKKITNKFTSSIKMNISISGDDVYKAIISPWIEQKDDVQQFKSNMGNFIKDLKGEKLVLVIDELDRCKPDFAVKTLEILKHFFDIDGLYIILMINRERLEKHISAFYNLPFDNKENGEEFLQKFINRFEYIPTLNYEVIVDELLTMDRLKEAIKTGNITEDETKFNSFKELKYNLIECCKTIGITYRETEKFIDKCITFCNYYNEPIRCVCLPYELARIDFHKVINSKLFNSVFIHTKRVFIEELKNKCYFTYRNNEVINNWKDIDRCMISLGYTFCLQDFNISIYDNDPLSASYKKLKSFGSDDNDEERMKDYEIIAKDFNKLYEKSKKQ